MRLGLAAIAVLLSLAAARSTIRFEEIAARAGVTFVADSCPTPKKNQPETMVAGVALFDYDGDGDLDIYYVNGAAIPSLVKEDPKYHNRLYRNNGDLTFTDVTERAGVAGAGYGMGVAAGDYDNDGRPDLYVVNVTANQLFRNNGDGTFSDVTAKGGVAGGVRDGKKMWSVAAAWFDYDNNGLLDLFVSNYCVWEVNKDPECMDPAGRVRGYCHPKYYRPLPNQIYRNNGDGTFTDVSKELGIAEVLGKGMGIGIADYDADGFMDVFVANDTVPNQLFHNLGGKRFEEIALQLGVAYDDAGRALSGMGAEFRDVDNDGRPDIWHSAVEHETFPLFMNKANDLFINTTAKSGISKPTWHMSGWSTGSADLDNDGWKDLFVARANVLDNISQLGNREYREPNSIFRNLGNGTFTEASADAGPDFQKPGAHRGVAFGDIDNDGRIDAVMSVLGGPAKIFRNTSDNKNHWLLLQLTGTRSNRMGIGAQVRITDERGRKQYSHVTTSTGYAASSDPRVHFGLGDAAKVAEMEIRWPSGIKQVLKDVTADQILKIEEPKQ